MCHMSTVGRERDTSDKVWRLGDVISMQSLAPAHYTCDIYGYHRFILSPEVLLQSPLFTTKQRSYALQSKFTTGRHHRYRPCWLFCFARSEVVGCQAVHSASCGTRLTCSRAAPRPGRSVSPHPAPTECAQQLQPTAHRTAQSH